MNRAALEIDAAVGLTNHATVALIQALGDGGLAIGRDLGLAGIDDFTAARVLRPGVTVVAQPVAQIAQEAVRMLLELMAGRPLSQLHVELSPRLIPRGSLGESASLEMTSPALPDVSPDPLEAL